MFSRSHIATIALIVLNTVLYIATVASTPDHWLGQLTSKTLIDWGANFGPLTLNGQPWRLVTCTFLHASLTHILVNLCLLFTLGREMEQSWGTRRFLIVYFLTAIVGSLVSVEVQPLFVSVGASGAIFGLFGSALSSVGGFDEVLKTIKRRIVALAIFVLLILCHQFFVPGIDNLAHLGGLITGILSGLAFSILSSNNLKYRAPARAVLVTLICLPFIAYFIIWAQYQGDLRFKAHPHYMDGGLLIKDKKYEEALAAFNLAVQELTDPDAKYNEERKAILEGRIRALIKLKRFDEALRDIATIEAMTEKKAPVLAMKAHIKHQQKNYKEAVNLFKQAVLEDPDSSGIFNDLAWSQAAIGQLDDALVNVNKALEKDNNAVSTIDTRGTIYLLQKKYDDAEKDLSRAIRINPKEGAPYFHRAWIHVQRGQKSKSDEDLKASLAGEYEPDGWEQSRFPELVLRQAELKNKIDADTHVQ